MTQVTLINSNKHHPTWKHVQTLLEVLTGFCWLKPACKYKRTLFDKMDKVKNIPSTIHKSLKESLNPYNTKLR